MDLLVRNVRVADRRWVIRRGKVIAETTPPQTTLLAEPVTYATR